MTHKKRANVQWEGAWIAVLVLSALAVFPIRVQAQDPSSAQTDSSQTGAATPANANPSAGSPEVIKPDVVNPDSAGKDSGQEQPQTSTDASNPDDASSQPEPVVNSLATGLPLHSRMSPLHWGHLSLLSFSAFGIYDSNYQLQTRANGSDLGGVEGLAIYSIQRSRASLDLQYHPYVWASPRSTYSNFVSNSVDFHTSFYLSHRWILALGDAFQYSPALTNSLNSAFNADFINNTVSNSPFLTIGRKFWTNNGSVSLSHAFQRSQLNISVSDSFVKITTDGSIQQALPAAAFQQELHSFGPAVSWSRQWNSRNTVSLNYSYRRQIYPGTMIGSDFQTAGIGYGRLLKPTVHFSIEVGPGWSRQLNNTSATNNTYRTTLQGNAQLLKQFRTGGVALSFVRSSEFSGIVSNSYNNRYGLAVNRRFFTRWNLGLSGSYVQQQFAGKQMATGEMGSAQVSYMVSRNWSVFTGYRYFSTNRVNSFAPQQLATAGVSWAWQPESSHR